MMTNKVDVTSWLRNIEERSTLLSHCWKKDLPICSFANTI